MIHILFHVKKEQMSIRIKGHSTLKEKGQDILCASVSTIASMIEIAVMGVLKEKVLIEKKEGFFFTLCRAKTIEINMGKCLDFFTMLTKRLPRSNYYTI